MSANNQIVISKKGKKFVVREFDMDCGFRKGNIAIEDTLEEAVKKANVYMRYREVEYGLNIRI